VIPYKLLLLQAEHSHAISKFKEHKMNYVSVSKSKRMDWPNCESYFFQLFKGRFFAFATQTQMAKFEQCISYAGGQAGVFAHPNSKYRDPSIFEIPNNLLIQPEQPIKSKYEI